MIKRILILLCTAIALVVIAPTLYLLLTPNLEISNLKLLFNVLAGVGVESPHQQTLDSQLQLPEGFRLTRYAAGLPGVRMLVLTETGDLLVSLPRKGQVVRLTRDMDADGRSDDRAVLLDKLDRPHGLAFWKKWLYVAEQGAVGRIEYEPLSGKVTGQYQRLISGLPKEGNHWSKSIGFGPDGMLYLSIGSTCNVCVEKDARRATIMRFNAEGGEGEIIASGLRNSVGFDWAPWNDALYATDNGRDMLGDDYPPCELNRIEQGQFYGWPFINGFADLDPDVGQGKESLLETSRSPIFGFRAHNAPLGIRFNQSTVLPENYKRSAFVALHGSWNRSTPDGYKLVSLHWNDQEELTTQDFLTGFEREGKIIGRPVDIVQGVRGELYVSDDYSGMIYLIEYVGSAF